MLRTFEESLINQLKNAYSTKENIKKAQGVSIFHEPFTHCIINDLITDDSFLENLTREMNNKLKYKKKNNDLYKFHQTADLGKSKLEHVSRFRDEVLYGKMVDFFRNVTGIELSSTKVDVTSSKYDFSDYLLCHDDDIHDDNGYGRRIAFVFYLVPPDWNPDGSDGGNLDLFKVDDKLSPTEICKSVVPVRNSLLCFEVSDRSFHQVSEVFSKTKTRLSINGWLHGPINHRPIPQPFLLPQTSTFKTIEPDLFFDWVAEKYLKPSSQSEVQLVFSSSSEIKLDKMFNCKKYDEVSDALSSSEIIWKLQGPANKRCYETAEIDSLPKIVRELIDVLTSDCMGLCLSNMTALRLHPSMPKSKETEEDDDDDEDEDDDEDDDDEEEDEDNDIDDDEVDKEDKVEPKESNGQKRKNENESEDGSKPGTSKSDRRKKLKKEEVGDDKDEKENEEDEEEEEEEIVVKPTKNAASAEEEFTAKCSVEVRRWKQGHYTLITDDNDEIHTKALDLMLFFKCRNWSLECGGNVSYIARNEDDELLTVQPEENCASLVYRDEETLKFTKFVNSRLNETGQPCFYEISLVYYE